MTLLERKTGTVKFFNEKKGYGFIIPDGDGKDIFFHVRSVHGMPAPKTDNKVSFQIKLADRGEEAVDVKPEQV
jgi:cold shock protein